MRACHPCMHGAKDGGEATSEHQCPPGIMHAAPPPLLYPRNMQDTPWAGLPGWTEEGKALRPPLAVGIFAPWEPFSCRGLERKRRRTRATTTFVCIRRPDGRREGGKGQDVCVFVREGDNVDGRRAEDWEEAGQVNNPTQRHVFTFSSSVSMLLGVFLSDCSF